MEPPSASLHRLVTRRTRWLVAPLLVFGVLGCLDIGPVDCEGPRSAGGRCQVGKSSCAAGYYCALTETCTRGCENDSDCLVTCTSMSTGSGCGVNDSCDLDAGICESSKPMRCVQGFCQGNCPLDTPQDGGPCEYDLYGPSSFDGGG